MFLHYVAGHLLAKLVLSGRHSFQAVIKEPAGVQIRKFIIMTLLGQEARGFEENSRRSLIQMTRAISYD